MKKALILLPFVLLLAAGCNSNQSANLNGSADVKGSTTIDSTVNDLNADVDAEASVQDQTDVDVIGSDKDPIINSSTGVTNEINY